MPSDLPIQRRYHPHATLLVFSALSLLLAVGAFNSNNNLLFWLFGLALSLIVVSGVVSGSMLMGLRIRRVPPPPGTAGCPLRVRYAVRNRNRLVPSFAIRIVDRAAPAPGRERRPSAPVVEGFIAYVGPGQTRIIEGLARADARGRWSLDRFQATTEFPFGIIRKSLLFSQPAQLVVRPASIDPGVITTFRPPAHEAANTPGLVSRWRSWVGEEQLAGIREYAPGDQPGIIAWRASARANISPTSHEALLVKQSLRVPPARRDVYIQLHTHTAHDAATYESLISRALGAAHRLASSTRGASVRIGLRLGDGRPLVHAHARALAAITQALTDLPRFGEAPAEGPASRSVDSDRAPPPETTVVHIAAPPLPDPAAPPDSAPLEATG